MIKRLLCITFIVSFASSYTTQLDSYDLAPLWGSWKQIYQKNYPLFQEESARFSVFMDNYRKIVEFNSKSGDHPNALKLALNKFADLTQEEFQSIYAGGYLAEDDSDTDSYFNAASSSVDYSVLQLPSSVDWREKGAVTPVKNQQHCGSCWSFSTTGALESLYFLTQGKLQTFSEQQIVDCDTQNEGCNGGFAALAFEYTANAGLETEADYPYTATDGKCQYDASKATKINNGYKRVTPRNAYALKATLTTQPVSVSIQADQDVLHLYKSGVITASAGCGADLNHAVLAVGYETIEGDEAFIVKNSWGTDWGVNGYVYISTDNRTNRFKGVCGILGRPVFPTV